MFGKILDKVREKAPLIHHITNYVTANDCANILIACGASPIMADDPREVEEITSGCDGLVINIGTLNEQSIPAMKIAGKKAVELNHPVVLDPVGAGASGLRCQTVLDLMGTIDFSVIRGNISEIKTLAFGHGRGKGVDGLKEDKITENNLDEMITFAKKFATQNHVILSLSGVIDLVTDGGQTFCIRNGHPMMAKITGTGCMLSSLITAFLSVESEKKLEAVATAVIAMGIAGEKAYARMAEQDGNASFRQYLIDAMFHLTAKDLEKGEKYEVR